MIPALCPVKMMAPDMQKTMRMMFRNLAVSGFVKSELGLEATEEVLEIMFDTGRIKFSMEPQTPEGAGMRLLMFKDKVLAYGVLQELILKNPPPNETNVIIEGK